MKRQNQISKLFQIHGIIFRVPAAARESAWRGIVGRGFFPRHYIPFTRKFPADKEAELCKV